MQISPGIEIIGLSLWIEEKKVLIVSDPHIGYEEYLQQKGVLLPKFQAKAIITELEKILQKVSPKTIIINGDLKHEFGTVSRQEWKEVLQLIDFLQQHCCELILVRGNHDIIIGPIASKRNIKIVDKQLIKDILIIHGNKLIKTPAKRIIIGHEHPAISLRENAKTEKYKCFLKGKWNNQELIVMPSFNPLLEGTDLITEKPLSPFLEDLSNFEVFIASGSEVFHFGKWGITG
ncbi:metallophosphoesterase [Candidatus Woesearchaeota archaeon]|nr:metallophosphoesterase [Candidatus Woesearchaeota archaeon]